MTTNFSETIKESDLNQCSVIQKMEMELEEHPDLSLLEDLERLFEKKIETEPDPDLESICKRIKEDSGEKLIQELRDYNRLAVHPEFFQKKKECYIFNPKYNPELDIKNGEGFGSLLMKKLLALKPDDPRLLKTGSIQYFLYGQYATETAETGIHEDKIVSKEDALRIPETNEEISNAINLATECIIEDLVIFYFSDYYFTIRHDVFDRYMTKHDYDPYSLINDPDTQKRLMKSREFELYLMTEYISYMDHLIGLGKRAFELHNKKSYLLKMKFPNQ